MAFDLKQLLGIASSILSALMPRKGKASFSSTPKTANDAGGDAPKVDVVDAISGVLDTVAVVPSSSSVTDLTEEQLLAIMSKLNRKRFDLLPYIQEAMDEFDINTGLRRAAFLAQLAHESGELRYMEELASGEAYEGRKDLGNVEPGDGKRYKGRGPIQLTGRANYRLYGSALDLDLEEHPEAAAKPSDGFRIAGLFWKRNGLNQLADDRRFKEITKRINGGYNGLADRERYYARALKAFGLGET